MPASAKTQALWTTAKALLATITTDVTTLQNDLVTMESLRAQLAGGDGGEVADWLGQQLRQLAIGWAPYSASPGGPARITVFAPEPSSPRQLSVLGDQRPISTICPGLS
jgi:hypothetical protein